DLSGPFSPTALGGYKCMAKFTDQYSRPKVVYFIKAKSEALSTLVKYIQDLAIPLGLGVHRLRSDRGDENIADYFRRYCKTTGILQEFSSPHSPQQNGMSERNGRTHFKFPRCFLNEAGLPRFLWGEIAATSVFLSNRLQHRSINGETPYYRMFGKQANLAFLRIIGSRAFVHKKGHINKLKDTAWEGVLIGHDDDSPTYRIYDRYSGKIYSSRNVTFIEQADGATNLRTDSTPTASGENINMQHLHQDQQDQQVEDQIDHDNG
ncbi:unnamed protein product, partial [Sphacelaria rigidula]